MLGLQKINNFTICNIIEDHILLLYFAVNFAAFIHFTSCTSFVSTLVILCFEHELLYYRNE